MTTRTKRFAKIAGGAALLGGGLFAARRFGVGRLLVSKGLRARRPSLNLKGVGLPPEMGAALRKASKSYRRWHVTNKKYRVARKAFFKSGKEFNRKSDATMKALRQQLRDMD